MLTILMEPISSINWATWIIFLVVFWLTYEWYKRRHLPPGPFSLPLLGSVGFYGMMAGQPPHVALAKLRETYGDICSVWVGPSLVIVLNGYEVIRRAFVDQGTDIIDRPSWLPIFKAGLKDGNGVSFSNGPEWQAMRKLCLQSIKDFGTKGGDIETKILEEVGMVQETFKQSCGTLMDMRHTLKMAVSNVINYVIFGQRFEYDDTNLHNLIRIYDLVLTGSGFVAPTNFLPEFMHPLFPEEHKLNIDRKNAAEVVKVLMEKIYQRHEETFDSHNLRDLMDVYIHSGIDDPTQTRSEHFHKGNLWRVINDLFLAGSETTASALEWAFLYMIEMPDIQRTCQKLITDVVGDRQVRMSDRPNLPYIDAVLNEVLRICNIAPLSLPRTSVTRDIKLNGFTIPKYSVILANIYSTHVDPTYWPDPFKFKPERFLDCDGKLLRKDAFLPFSLGPRNCLGENLSRVEMFLIFVNLLQKFRFSRDETAEKHDFSLNGKQYVTLRPRPYKVIAMPRV